MALKESTKKVTIVSAGVVLVTAITAIAVVCKKLFSLLVSNET